MKNIIFLLALLGTIELYAQYAVIHEFDYVNGSSINAFSDGALLSDGIYLYGTGGGGTNGAGVIFKIKPDGTDYNVIHNFDGVNGEGPNAHLTTDGLYLFGTTHGGGLGNDFGVIFKIKLDGANYTVIHYFDGVNGIQTVGGVVTDGTYLYGRTDGIIYKIKPDGTGFSVIFDFDLTSGFNGSGTLLLDGTYLYGTTTNGGVNDFGVIFKIKPDGTSFTKLYDFDGVNGNHPMGSLITDGVYLYGMTQVGGTNDNGVIFKIKPDGTSFSKVLDFDLGAGSPIQSLLLDGTFLYGTNNAFNGWGAVFKVKPDGTNYTFIHQFNWVDGLCPCTTLISDGTYLYGTTNQGGGVNDSGVIFKLVQNTAGIEEINSTGEISVFPNPTAESITIEFYKETDEEKYIIFDQYGRKLLEGCVTESKTTLKLPFGSGIYYLKIRDEVMKVMVER